MNNRHVLFLIRLIVHNLIANCDIIENKIKEQFINKENKEGFNNIWIHSKM